MVNEFWLKFKCMNLSDFANSLNMFEQPNLMCAHRPRESNNRVRDFIVLKDLSYQ